MMQAATTCLRSESRLWGQQPKLAALTGFLLLVLGSVFAAQAQETTGTIAGNVSDTSGAAVVGSTVSATNTLTNTVRSTVTDSAGQYTLPSLPAGTYSLDVEMTGFQGQRTDSIVLDAGQSARQDFKISIGKVNETVTIQAGAAALLLQTENATVGGVIDGKKIVDLPLNGRDFIQLAQLIPGANAGAANSITDRRARGSIATSDATYGSTALQVNGARDTQNRFSIDGIESMDYDGFTYNFSPSIDAIAEFRVDTSTSGTDVGAAAGANVNQIIKSGTNNLHGTLWEFNRNNAFTQSWDALAHVSATPARLNLNQFGGNVGGPVYMPKVYDGRNKTFFFFNAETGYLLNGVLQASTAVPDAAVRSGDIDELITAANAASGGLRPLVNPYTKQPFVLGQKITVAPNSLVMLNPAITPLPNITPAPGTTNNFDYPSTKTNNYQHDYIGRGDQTIGSKDTVSGHYIFDVTYSNGPATWANNNDNNKATSKHFVVAETHVFSPSLVNEFRYGWSNFVEIELFGTSNTAAYNIANGMMQIPFSSSNPRYFGPPNITIGGPGTAYTLFNLQRTIGPRNRSNGINQFVENFSLQKGKHFLKFGADIGKRADYFNLARDPRGTFSFDGRFTAPYSTGVPGSGLLDFLLGYIATASINPTQTNDIISSWVQGYSAQDNWNVTPTLTVNLGLRWDHYAPWVEKNNLYSDVYVAGDSNGWIPEKIVTPANSSYGRGLIQPVYHDFGPRVGFAYQPYGLNKVVVRGGYGIYYTPEIANVFYQMAEGAQEANAAAPTGNLGDGVAGQTIPNLTWSNPFPGTVASSTPSYITTPELSQHLQDQMNQEYNLTVQTELPGKVSGQIGFVGARGTHTFQYYSDVNAPPPVNPATPGLGSTNSRRANPAFAYAILGDLSTGSSSYNSLQARLERRVGNGLNFLASYTWSKSISGPGDIGGLVGGGLAGAQAYDPYDPREDRSRSVYDLPQRFVVTALYDLPFFRNTTGVTKLLLDGFQVSTIVTAISGDLLSPGYTGPSVNASTITTRADVVPGQQVSVPNKTPLRVFNTGAFKNPAVATFGNAPRMDIRAPGYLDSDLSATKGFKFGESRNLQFRADFFNAFRHFNATAASIDTNLNDAFFGRIGNGVNQQYATRIIQLGGKLYF
jgi:Carboxypeptidase regulatory-like domain/TonB dependent receptor